MGPRATLVPGATVGVLGGGQLGRMLAVAAKRLGLRVVVLDPTEDAPAAQVADRALVAAYDDVVAARELARASDVLTFEFENVPAGILAELEELAPVRPSPRVLETCRHRAREKRFLEAAGLAVAPWRHVPDRASLDAAVAELGTPCVLKTCELGYDGKGQARLDAPGDAAAAWEAVGGVDCVLEGFVAFDRELSAICARTPSGERRVFPIVENAHANHVLDVTLAPAPGPAATRERAVAIAERVAEELGLEGLVAVELFDAGGELLVNELAPRPHNTGHWTLEGCATDQFEQHLRAVLDLPLGSTALRAPSAMANLLGELWNGGEPDWSAALREPDAHLHLYGKRDPRPGRKMGHLTVVDATAERAAERARAVRARLAR